MGREDATYDVLDGRAAGAGLGPVVAAAATPEAAVARAVGLANAGDDGR